MPYPEKAAAKAALAIMLIVLAGSAALGAQEDALFSVSGSLDWSSYELEAVISLDAEKAGLRMPSGRAQAESLIRNEAPRLLRDVLLPLQVDSRRTLAEAIASGDLSLEAITEILEAPQAMKSSFSEDFRSFRCEYSVSMLGILSLLVRHSQASPRSATLDYRPTKEYTGIVIYADGMLPVHGEFSTQAFRPSLFPRVWDDRMDLVLERNMVEPETAKDRGMVGYRKESDPGFIEDRAGGEPLRILAIGVFGSERGDLVISREDALKIWANEKNRALLQAGRVVIMVANTRLDF